MLAHFVCGMPLPRHTARVPKGFVSEDGNPWCRQFNFLGINALADAIFVMAAPYLRRLLIENGADLGAKSYLFADPFTKPMGFANREYAVNDPTWDTRPAAELCREHAWMRERVAEINEALHGRGRPLVPAVNYLDVLADVDPLGH